MKAFWLLFVATLKMTIRNKQALFWMLAFPMIFLVIFGLFNMDKMAVGRIIVLDRAQTETSEGIVKGFKEGEVFTVVEGIEANDTEGAKQKIIDGEADFAVIIPEKFKELAQNNGVAQAQAMVAQGANYRSPAPIETPEPINLEVYYNEANVTVNPVVLNAMEQMATSVNMKAAQTPEIIKIDKKSVTNRRVRYIDFLIPGIVAMSLMQSAIIGIAVFLTEAREKKILKRILATPVNRRSYIAAQVMARLIIALLQAVIILGAARLIHGVEIYGSYWNLLLWALLGTAVFLMIGFIVASFSKTTSAAESLSQVVSMPMLFLSGVFFPTDSLPDWVQKIVDYLPLTPVITALRAVTLDGKALSETLSEFWIVGAWILATFIIALFSFRTARE
ncbi:ABC transporter permease [Patescibacteria group bacterium]|nr:ABC transporter permease [Patescibacteria group bacterium]